MLAARLSENSANKVLLIESGGKDTDRYIDQCHGYVRGQKQDYDSWAQMGCRAWSYDKVLRPMKRRRSDVFSPVPTDAEKRVLQLHDGAGEWQSGCRIASSDIY